MAIINIGGKGIHIDGNLSMCGNKWYVDGEEVDLKDLASEVKEDKKSINITINIEHGSIDHLDVKTCKTITINGNCKRVKTNMGDIIVKGDIDGDAHTNMGNIECGNVGGDAHSNMGSVHYRR